MKRTLVNAVFGGLGALLALGLLPALPAHAKSDKAPPPKLNIQSAPLKRDTKLATSFAPIIKTVGPSVVYVSTTKTVREPEMRLHPFFNDPMFRRFFGEDPEDVQKRGRPRQETGLGSGVIVTEDGYILTNNHVIEGADEIKVETSGGKEYVAKVIGTDPPTDMAVLKIEAEKLPALAIGNSDGLEVGDVVLAIGNPFGIGQTVTMGIISAIGRGELGIVDYEDFIQTDASINPGNSGGALVDAEGRLIGINSAILSRTGGNMGVGFAVPVNMARSVMERLTEDGKVARGFLGVGIQPITPELAKEFKLPDQNGALVSGFSENSPAEKAGLAEGDVIVEFNGKKVSDNRHLRLMVSQTAPKTESTLKVIRDGEAKTFKFKLAELPGGAMAGTGPDGKAEPADNEALQGVEVGDLDAKNRRQYEIPPRIAGALVISVDPESNSHEAGLRAGDVILELNRRPVRTSEEAVEMSAKVKGDRVLLRIWSRGNSRFLTVENGGPKESKR